MKISILGTGNVGQTFAEKLVSLGHSVMMGTRKVSETMERETFKSWFTNHSAIALEDMETAAAFGEIIINALNGSASLEAFESFASDRLSDKIILDLSNPLDFSKGFPPALIQKLQNVNSLGEELQKILPKSKVVKTLNTLWCGLMINPSLIGDGNHLNFICGNDQDAKEKVKALLNEFGWKNENILDLGNIDNARGTEAYLLLWTRIYAATNNGAFNIRIVA